MGDPAEHAPDTREQRSPLQNQQPLSSTGPHPSSFEQQQQDSAANRDESKKRSLLAAAQAGVYIPPAKRRQLLLEQQQQQQQAAQQQPDQNNDSNTPRIISNNTLEQQKQTWDDQKRVIHGTINRLNAATIKPLLHDLFLQVNLIRLRGVLAKSLLLAAASAQRYTAVYAALVAVINTKLPQVGELVVKRAILAFRRYYLRREKQNCIAMSLLLGHLFHQAVVPELVILQILTVLLDGDPTDDSVEVAIQLLTVTGYALLEVTPAGVRAVLERLRALLHEGQLNPRAELKMERLLALRQTGFREQYPPIPKELDLLESDDQITFEISLDDEDIQKEDYLDAFRVDPNFVENEKVWSKIRAEILGLGDDDSDDEDTASEADDDEEEEASNDDGQEPDPTEAIVPAATTGTVIVQDLSEADLVHLRRTIYLTIMSSATFEECAHKLAKIDIPTGREEELINMLIECCSQERTFLRYYGLIAARFCLMDDRWRDAFMDAFAQQYSTIHRLETNKLRNVAKLFAHLLHSDSLPWSVLAIVHLNEDETTSSSRIFIKILVQEIAEAMGIAGIKKRFGTEDPEHKEWYKGMFPQDNVRNTRYAINFFTSIGLGPLTDGLREFLKNAPKMIMTQTQQQTALAERSNDDDSSTASSSSSSSSGSSSLSSSTFSSSTSESSSSSSSYYRRSKKKLDRKRRSRSPNNGSSVSGSYSQESVSSSSSSHSSRSRSRSRSPPRRSNRSRSYSSSDASSRRSPPPNPPSRRSASSSDRGHHRRNGSDDDDSRGSKRMEHSRSRKR